MVVIKKVRTMARRGMGKGKGKGYKNLVRRDKVIHSQSAKGIKQPQRVSRIKSMPVYKSIDPRRFRFGSIEWQTAMLHNIKNKLHLRQPINDMEKGFLDIQVVSRGIITQKEAMENFSKPAGFLFRMALNRVKDSDSDGVPDYMDCDPFDPNKHEDSFVTGFLDEIIDPIVYNSLNPIPESVYPIIGVDYDENWYK